MWQQFRLKTTHFSKQYTNRHAYMYLHRIPENDNKSLKLACSRPLDFQVTKHTNLGKVYYMYIHTHTPYLLYISKYTHICSAM